ncbi:DUF6223 family protein [Streptomyces sp. NBC_01799]|nr:DUF6223 family protein [Streptomyces sp. NBC_01799]
MSAGRLEATTAAVLGLIGAAIAGLAPARPNGRFATGSGRLGAKVALAAPFIWWTACSAGWRCSARREMAALLGLLVTGSLQAPSRDAGSGPSQDDLAVLRGARPRSRLLRVTGRFFLRRFRSGG